MGTTSGYTAYGISCSRSLGPCSLPHNSSAGAGAGAASVLGPSISEDILPRPPDHLCGMDDPLPSCQTYPSGASVSFLLDP